MTLLNNPAARLYAILRKAKNLPNQNALKAWSEILSVAESNQAELIRRLGLLIALPSQIRAQIELIPEIDTDLYLKWIPEIDAGFSKFNLSASLTEFTNPISESSLNDLRYCSDVLSRKCPENTLDLSELESLKNDLLELIDRFLASSIEDHLKRLILEKLYSIHVAIQDYTLSGIMPLTNAVRNVVGTAITDQETIKGFNKTKLGADFWKMIHRVAMIVSILYGTAQLQSGISTLLLEYSNADGDAFLEVESEETIIEQED